MRSATSSSGVVVNARLRLTSFMVNSQSDYIIQGPVIICVPSGCGIAPPADECAALDIRQRRLHYLNDQHLVGEIDIEFVALVRSVVVS
jgi:hypothetical protein